MATLEAADDWITASAASGGKDDWVTAPKAPVQHDEANPAFSREAIPQAPETPGQSLAGAGFNAAGQGLVHGTGSVIAGVGRGVMAAAAGGTQRQLAVMDAIDAGREVPQEQDAIGYQFLSPEQRTKARAEFTTADADLSKREPNAAVRAGMAIEGAAPEIFPVAPENEGHITGVGRLVGGVVPALAATAAGSAVGGPAGGVLAAMAMVGSQTYDTTYQEAVAKGAKPEDAEDAAGKSALTQAAVMAVPVSRLLQRVPMPMRDGLMATLINLGKHGVEFGSANAIGAFANNYVAQQTYDPQRALTKGTGDAALEGAIAGLIIPAIGGIGRAVRERPTADDVMKAPDLDTAIATAREAASLPTEPQPASRYETAPAFIPPQANPPLLGRIRSLINEDSRIAANRPDFLPPAAQSVTPEGVPLPGTAAPVKQPPIPMNWGDLFAPRSGRETEALASDGVAPEAAAAPEPQSVGAAASRDMAAPGSIPPETPAQKATALQKMINQSAEDRVMPGGRDDAAYVPGVERPEAMRDFASAAEGEQSSSLAHKVLYNTDSNYHDTFDAQVKKNNAVMVDGLGNLMGDANARDAAMEHAKELMPGPIGLFDGETAVNAQPIESRINEILAGPAGKRGAVRSLLTNILSNLKDSEGNLEALPSMLKGVRDDITDKLYDKSPTTEGNAARTARNQLQDVLSVVDNTIAEGLPGTKYQDYLTNLSAALGAVSKLDYLQKFLTGPRKLTDLAGNLQFRKVQNLLEDIQAHHADRTGGAKELSIDEINQIEAVRNELAAKDLLDRRAAVRGSPTIQLGNASGVLGDGPLGAGVKGAAEVALHLGLAPLTGGVGNAALAGYRFIFKPAVDAAKAQKAAAALAETKQRLLNTTPSAPDLQ